MKIKMCFFLVNLIYKKAKNAIQVQEKDFMIVLDINLVQIVLFFLFFHCN